MKKKPWSVSITTIASLALAVLAFASSSVLALQPPPAATVTAKKGPVQITLRLYKKKTKIKRSLWYQIELKNVGKKKMMILDKIFRDPWAIYDNNFHKDGIYLEVHAISFADGTKIDEGPITHVPYLRLDGGGQVGYDYVDKGLPPEEAKAHSQEIVDLEAQWKKQGLSDAERKQKLYDWNIEWNSRKQREEDMAKLSWLAPGASTTTFAWAHPCDRDLCISPDEAKARGLDHSYFDGLDDLKMNLGIEKQVGDYTQLWSFHFYRPGRYRIRAVYNNDVHYTAKQLAASPWYIKVTTPYIDFEVLP